MKKITLIFTIMLIISVSFVSATPSFIMRKNVDTELIYSALSKVDLKDYDGYIDFKNYYMTTETKYILGYFSFEYNYNIQTFKTYNYRYKITIFDDAYVDEETLICTLKHELAHYEEMKNNKKHGYTLSEEYANEHGCKTNV